MTEFMAPRPPNSIPIRSKPDYWISTTGDVVEMYSGANVPVAGFGFCAKCQAEVPYVKIGFEEVSIPELLMESFYGPLNRRIFTMKPGYWFDLDYLVYDAMERSFNIDGSNPGADIELRTSVQYPVYAVSDKGFVFNLKEHRPQRYYGSGRYPMVMYERNSVLVHRLVYAAYIGPIDFSLQIDHLDHNRYNPDASNLEQVTAKENAARKYTTGVMRHCLHLTEDEELELVKRLSNGERSNDIAKSMGLTYNRAFKHITWRVVRDPKYSKYYNPMGRRSRADALFTNQELIELRDLMEAGYSSYEIAKIKGIEYTKRFRNCLSAMARAEYHKELVIGHDFSKFRESNRQRMISGGR